MKNKTLKNAIILFVIIVLSFVFCLGVILLVKSKTTEKVVDAKDVTFVGETNVVTISRVISVSSDFGRNIEEDNAGAFGYISFDIVNHSEEERNFQVFVSKEETDLKVIHSGYVTLYLTDENNQPVEGYTRDTLPTYNKLHYMEHKADSKVLYKGTLNGNETKHFKLRVWVSEYYTVQDPGDGFSFRIDACAV